MNTEPLKCTISDLADDLPSVFTNAKVVGDGICHAEYSKQSAKRGEIGYVMSRSDLCEFDRCPSRWIAGYEDDGSRATRWGQLMDCMVLAQTRFEKQYAVAPATYCESDTQIAKKWNRQAAVCKAWEADAELEGKIVVKNAEHERAIEACGTLLQDTELESILLNSHREVMVTADYRDKETGIVVPVKCLIDIVPDAVGFLVDFKTCANAAPRPWAKAVFERDYHTQAALYLDLWNAATNVGRDEFRHILQENFEPWQVAKRIVSVEFVSLGRQKYQRILKRYAECLKSGAFPNYEDRERNHLVIGGWGVTEPEPYMNLCS
jgi:PDDEXK-like uncharacterized protein DUF3799